MELVAMFAYIDVTRFQNMEKTWLLCQFMKPFTNEDKGPVYSLVHSQYR